MLLRHSCTRSVDLTLAVGDCCDSGTLPPIPKHTIHRYIPLRSHITIIMKTDEKIVSLFLLSVCVLCRRLTTTTDATWDGYALSMSECLLCTYLYVCWFGTVPMANPWTLVEAQLWCGLHSVQAFSWTGVVLWVLSVVRFFSYLTECVFISLYWCVYVYAFSILL